MKRSIANLQRFFDRTEHTVENVLSMGVLVMDLGHRRLDAHPQFDFAAAAERVREHYRSLLNQHPHDARCLNDRAALLLSVGQIEEGRRFALLALAAAPDKHTVHENLYIADRCSWIEPAHQVPKGLRESGFLCAYFDPQAL